MAIQTRAATLDFSELMGNLEGHIDLPYDDGEGLATIGIGTNIEQNRQYLALVLRELGVFAKSDERVVGSETEARRNARYQAIINEFQSIIVSANLNRTTGTPGETPGEQSLQQALNTALHQYVSNIDFVLTPDQARNVVEAIVDGSVIGLDLDGNGQGFMHDAGKRARLNARLQNAIGADGQAYGISLSPDSREYHALLSLFYNTEGRQLRDSQGNPIPGKFSPGTLVGNGLLTALSEGNRAEAWWEIRYNSNGGDSVSPGIAKRRYAEAAIFGLYNDETNVSAEEAREVYRTLQLHRQKILDYEKKYGVMPDGTSPGRDMIDGPNGDGANTAGGYGFAGTAYEVDTLVESLDPAKVKLIAEINAENPALNLNPENYLSTNIYLDPGRASASAQLNADNRYTLDSVRRDAQGNEILSNDILIGEGGRDVLRGGAGNDVLLGGAGDDELDGGLGADELFGGEGEDTYIIDVKDGISLDRIVDSDGKGRIIIRGTDYEVPLGAMRPSGPAGSQTWTDPDGRVTLTRNSPWRITLTDGSIVELGESFDPAGFGLTFGDQQVTPANTFTGDFAKLLKPDGVTYEIDSLGNYVLDPSQPLGPQPDSIYGTVDADTINGGAGNDALSGGYADDQIEGGIGDDVLVGGLGQDVLNGGEGRDYIFGSGFGLLAQPARTDTPPPPANGPEWSRGFGWVAYDDGITANGTTYKIDGIDTSTLTNDVGNIIDGGAGDDLIRAGASTDIVHGGADNDDILGLARNDTLYGDAGNDTIFGDGALTVGTTEYVALSDHGDDTIDGGSGIDHLSGQGGDDRLMGGTGNDFLWGDEEITGDAAKDHTPASAHGNDYLDGGDNDDYIEGGGRDDYLLGGGGNDILHGDGYPVTLPGLHHGKDTVEGGSGADSLEGGGDDDILLGGTDNDLLIGDSSLAGLSGSVRGVDYLDGGDGDDTLAGGALGDSLLGGLGNDILRGDGALTIVAAADQGADYLDGGDGNDSLIGGGGADILLGGDNDDLLFGEESDTPSDAQGDDYLDGGNGNDTLVGGGAADTLLGGTGDDLLYGEASDTPSGAEGNDYLEGGEGNDTLAGGGGNDTLVGGAGYDTLFGEGGDDTLATASGSDALLGGAGSDTFVLGVGAGQVQITDTEGTNALEFGSGISSSDVTYILSGNVARIDFAPGDYAIMSVATFNTLASVKFADGTVWNTGDLLHAFQPGSTGPDHSIAINAGVSIEEVSTLRWNNDLILSYEGPISDWVDTSSFGARNVAYRQAGGAEYGLPQGSQALVLVNWYLAEAPNYLNQLSAAGGGSSDLVAAASSAQVVRTGSAADDIVVGTAAGERLIGLAGADDLRGGAGNDIYEFNSGDGEDLIQDTSGADDKIMFGAGISAADLVITETNVGLRVTVGPASNGDALTVADWASGSGKSIDRIVFDDGSSLDRAQIDALNTGNHSPRVTGTISSQTVRAGQVYNYLVPTSLFNDADAGDTLTYTASGPDGAPLPPWVTFNPGTREFFGIPESFDAGATPVTVTVTDAAGLSTSVTFSLRVTTAVQLTGTANGDYLRALPGSDYELYGLAGNDSLDGDAGNDILIGGLDSDFLEGGAGNDTYIYERGDGNDQINTYDAGTGKLDTLRFGAGISADDLVFSADYAGDLVIRFRNPDGSVDTADSIEIQGYLLSNSSVQKIDRFEFSDSGAYLTSAQVDAIAMVPSGGIDYIHGTSGADVISGLAGDDSLYGEAGNDTLVGGAGNDDLEGGAGSDTYVYNLGDGNDWISSALDSDPSSIDVLQFGPGILPSDVFVEQRSSAGTGRDLEIRTADGTARISVPRLLDVAQGAQVLDEVQFSDGTVWTRADILARGLIGNQSGNWIVGYASNDVIRGNGGNDSAFGYDGDDDISGGDDNDRLYGGDGNDILSGDAGDDSLYGEAGNDELSGGAGRDSLEGGSGDDVYHFGRGFGTDEIIDPVGTNQLILDAGIVPSDVSLYRTSSTNIVAGVSTSATVDDLVLVLDNGSTQIRMADFYATQRSVSQIIFADGTIWDAAAIDTHTTNLGGAANTFTGTTSNNSYTVDHLNDVINEPTSGGIDSVSASISYTLAANVENLTLTGPLHVNGTGNALGNIITGNALDNTLEGGGGIDTLNGMGGNDTFEFTDDNNRDTLAGGPGDDIYYIGAEGTSPSSFPRDTVVEASGEGYDTIYLAAWDYTLPANVERLIFTDTTRSWSFGSSEWEIFGNSLDNYIDVSRIDLLRQFDQTFFIDAGAGADTIVVAQGDDFVNRVIVDNVGDVVIDADADDTIVSSVSYALPEARHGWDLAGTLELTGSAPISGTGNAGSNELNGSTNSAANVLAGGLGDDVYILGSGDTALEGAGEGNDTVVTSAAGVHSLASHAHIENITVTDAAGTATLVGNAGANVLVGNIGANVLDGGAGDDTLKGGAGDDVYIVDSAGDLVVENTSEGVDAIQSAVTYALGANIENLTLAGANAANGTGNTLSNVLTGNDATNVLTGGQGDDTYVIDTADTVIENANEGIDTIQIASTYVLGANVENLTLMGANAVDGTGNILNNVLAGNSAANVLTGWLGDDTYVIGSGDTVVENANEGIDTVQSSVAYTLGTDLENLTLIGTAAISGTGNAGANILIGNSGNNTLTGNAGADTLDGGAGVDTLIGGAGDDIYGVDNSGDIITENAGEGIDLVQSSISYTLGATLEHLTLVGTSAINGAGNTLDNTLTGNSAVNTLSGGAGNDVLDGGAGNDILTGGAGNDTYIVDSTSDLITEGSGEGTDLVQAWANYTLSTNVENLTLMGAAALSGTGNALNNTLTGNAADNTLNGGTGADTLIGGAGSDTYVIDTLSDVIVEAAGGGVDLVQTTIAYTLGSELENLTLTGSSGVAGTGNALDNVITGNSGANTLNGGIGNDTLNGGSGKDTLIGGVGNDTYVVDNTGDVVTENANEGVDTVQSSITYTLGATVESLALTGTSGISGTGNALDNFLLGNGAANILTGGAGNDVLDGAAGNDTLRGGIGNDTYVVDSGSDVVTENANEGTDLVQAMVTYSISSNVENLTLIGASAINGTGNTLDNNLTGNAAVNTLTGGAGNDTLDGGLSDDVLVGGLGNDTYIVDSFYEGITENANEGTDLVLAWSNYTLKDNVENLRLQGTANIGGFGNALANEIIGNSGNNTLRGGTGADTLIGGAGNDSYQMFDDATDLIVENAGEGTDSVSSFFTYTLGSNLENLSLGGSSSISGTGNGLDNNLSGNSETNTLIGHAGNDVLNGMGSSDTMIGGTGDDTYYVDATGDVTTENAGEGFDIVHSTVTRTLSPNIEILFLDSFPNINGTGNVLSNLLRGNSGNNILAGAGGVDILEGAAGDDTLSNTSGSTLLSGGAGADTLTGTVSNDMLIGGTGNDVLTTGFGADLIVFNKGDGQDTVATSTGKDNTLCLGGGTAYADLLFQKNGNDLILRVGVADKITFAGYYASTDNRSIDKLQIVIEGTPDHDAASADATRNKIIETFDFDGLVAAFDAARAANTSLSTWALTNALTAQHLGGSDTAAIGGDLAYRYGRFGSLSDISFTPALGILGAAGFGTTAQSLQVLSSLQDPTPRLN